MKNLEWLRDDTAGALSVGDAAKKQDFYKILLSRSPTFFLSLPKPEYQSWQILYHAEFLSI